MYKRCTYETSHDKVSLDKTSHGQNVPRDKTSQGTKYSLPTHVTTTLYISYQEVKVGSSSKLLKQVEGQEGDQGVLGGLDKVVLEKG